MSIPPLVCSTPPPPDQCEEDKDPEDFDIRYNLSQEDEDDNNDYDYGSFSTFNHVQSQPFSPITENTPMDNDPSTLKDHAQSIPKNLTESPIKTENNLSKETIELQVSDIKGEITFQNSLKSEEDNNIEDLDLKLEECTTPNKMIIESDDFKNISIRDEPIIIPEVNEENIKISIIENQHEVEAKTICNNEFGPFEDVPQLLSANATVGENYDILFQTDLSHTDLSKSSKIQEVVPDYDFEDFDDFQYTNPEIESNIVIDNCGNPWESKVDVVEEFGNFTANFEHITINEPEQDTNDILNITIDQNFKENVQKDMSQDIGDDDFGDFDDFKSSNVTDSTKYISNEEQMDINHQLPVLNFEVADKGHQILDSVSEVLNSIFLEDIKEPDNEFECKLDGFLSETWGHLIETDVRQPYIVNWNNSLGQKTLLRALSIDSRNILFGPKWSYNMPKYAVTLSNAPLQPLKPVMQSTTSQNDMSCMEKVSNKAGNWNDPFTSDGQESCNTENEVSQKERKVANVEVFESTKPESIYPSDISIQPIRQISLPDTHIFTPTDSETPRSKTIHYGTGPTVLLSEEHSNIPHTFHSENTVSQPESNTETDKFEDDYWEFQDFKCTPKLNELPSNSDAIVTPVQTTDSDDQQKLNKAYQGELLQPIKISPIVPTLNWPNPGEVKEVFDDFSDFISNSSWSTESKDTTRIHSGKISNNGVIVDHGTVAIANDKVNNENINETAAAPHSNVTNNFYDEFDRFQYALPRQKINEIPNVDNLNIVTNSRVHSFPQKAPILNQKTNFEEAFTKLNFNLCDNISSTNQTKPNLPNATESSSKHTLTIQSHSNVLSPIPSSSNSQTQQKTGQILQPLSLESYSQLNWPSPGIDLQDLSKFNPVETLHSLKSELGNNVPNKTSSPVHSLKINVNNQTVDDELWGEFVSSKPKLQPSSQKKNHNFGDDEEWTDFVSSPSVKPQNGLNTISFNVHTNSNIHKNMYQNKLSKNKQSSIDIPTLNYITPKTNNHNLCNDRHFQNL